MTNNPLTFIINANKFLAVAPLCNNNIYQRIYAVFLVAVLTVIIVISSTQRHYLRSYTHIKLVISLLTDTIAYIFSCYVILQMTFFVKETWMKLINILSDSQKSKSHVASFCVLNIIFWVNIFASNYAFSQIVVFKKILDVVVIDVEVYSQFLFGYFMYNILNLLLAKYGRINNSILHYQSTNVARKKENFASFLEKISVEYQLTKQAVDYFNKIFGFPLLLMISYTTLHFVNYIDDFFFFRFEPEKFTPFLVSNVCLVSMIFLGNCILISKCHSVVQEASNTIYYGYKMREVIPKYAAQEKLELREFIDLVLHNKPKFSAAGFFKIKKSTIFNILGTVTTLLIVMIQFDSAV